MLTSPALIEIYLLVLSGLGLAGSLVLLRYYWVSGRWVSIVAWALVSGAWGWLTIGELLWNVAGWGEWITRMPRAMVFRILIVVGIWIMVFGRRRRWR